MQRRDAGCRNLDTQIPPGHHNAVRCRQNFIQIVHALLIFNFGDDFNIVSATLAEHRAYSLYIRRAADKRGSDEIKSFSTPKRISFMSFSVRAGSWM